MKRNTGNATAIVLVIIGVLIVIGMMFVGKSDLDSTSNVSTSTPQSSSATAKINGKTISLIVVDTEELREVGLGNRASLPADQAMLFVFDAPDTYEFWMKDMKFPIDIIWLDKDFKIVHIESDIAPETYPDETFMSETPALYVLEANALFAQQNNLKIGDTVEISLKK
jgi:uncharacterized protein